MLEWDSNGIDPAVGGPTNDGRALSSQTLTATGTDCTTTSLTRTNRSILPAYELQ